MTTKENQPQAPDCSTAGQGFARTDGTSIASESCGLPDRGFAVPDTAAAESTPACDCSTAGMGFARTDRTKIASEDCAAPRRGFATVDTGKKD